MTTFMLDTDTCALIINGRPPQLLQRMSDEVAKHNKFVISAITYAEMLHGQRAGQLSDGQASLIDEFVRRLDSILPWDQYAARDTFLITGALKMANIHLSSNAIAVAGHATAADCVLITKNEQALGRFAGLSYECWA